MKLCDYVSGQTNIPTISMSGAVKGDAGSFLLPIIKKIKSQFPLWNMLKISNCPPKCSSRIIFKHSCKCWRGIWCWGEQSTCTVALLTAVQGGCWRKPGKYFKNVKVLVSSPYLFSTGGPQQPENCYRKYKNNVLKKDVFQYLLQNASATGSLLAWVLLFCMLTVCVTFTFGAATAPLL